MSNYTINNPNKTLINGIEYNWSSVNFVIGGIVVEGITDISYSNNLTINPLYGRGNNVNSYSVGNHEKTLSFTLRKSELDKLEVGAQNATKKSILYLEPFNITVVYRSLDEVSIVTEILWNVMVTGIDTSTSQGDEAVSVSISAVFTDLEKIII